MLHEAGHAIAARLLGLEVPRVEFGLGRRLRQWRWGRTTLALNSFPSAGFTYLAGAGVRGVRGRLWLTIAAGPLVTAAIWGAALHGDPPPSVGEVIFPAAEGTYSVQYIAWTPMGNTVSAIRTVHVDDRTLPSLWLRGAARMTHTCGSGWVDPGVEAMDALCICRWQSDACLHTSSLKFASGVALLSFPVVAPAAGHPSPRRCAGRPHRR